MPSEPSSRANGVTSARSAPSSASSRPSPTPAPPAPIWFARTAIAARTTSVVSGAPPPPACERSRFHWWAPGSSVGLGEVRSEPTPVVTP